MMHPTDLLQRALDGELQPADRARLQAHLASCARCRAVLAAQQQTDNALRAVSPIGPPPDFLQRIEAQVARLQPPRRAAPWYLPLALCLLGMGLVGITLVWEEFAALASSVAATSDALTVWLFSTAGGVTEVENGSFVILGTQSPLGLVLGLCLLGAACVLVLRQQTEAL